MLAVALLALACLVIGHSVARAETALHDHTYPMRFAAHAGLEAKSPHCPGCSVVVGQGIIVKGTAKQLQTFLKRWGGDPSRVVLRLQSPGGDLMAALRLGRAVRSAGFQTEALSSRPCQSACVLAFVGGVAQAAQRNAIGVHDISRGTANVTQMARRGRDIAHGSLLRAVATSAVRHHLHQMGTSLRLAELASATPHTRMYKLSKSDLALLGIARIPHSP
jgi:hypothetical protein